MIQWEIQECSVCWIPGRRGILFQGEIQQKRIYYVYPKWHLYTSELSVCKIIHIFLNSSDHIWQRYIVAINIYKKNFKSLDLGFLSQHFMHPCRLFFYLVTCTQCIFIQHKGCWYSRTWEKCFPVCISKTFAQVASLYSGRGRGHTYATFMHAHRRVRVQAHTQAATQFNILPLKILSINKQLENYNKKTATFA